MYGRPSTAAPPEEPAFASVSSGKSALHGGRPCVDLQASIMRDEAQQVVFSIGHSNQSIEKFLSLLESHKIDVLVDVRSHPYSKYAPHFQQKSLSRKLEESGFRYLFLGNELGGKPEAGDFYDANGHVLYRELARSSLFLEGIQRLERGLESYRIAIMCAEENPSRCHRRLLITPVLEGRGINVIHIRGDGRLEPESEILRQEAQLTLFRNSEQIPSRSSRSILKGERRGRGA